MPGYSVPIRLQSAEALVLTFMDHRQVTVSCGTTHQMHTLSPSHIHFSIVASHVENSSALSAPYGRNKVSRHEIQDLLPQVGPDT